MLVDPVSEVCHQGQSKHHLHLGPCAGGLPSPPHSQPLRKAWSLHHCPVTSGALWHYVMGHPSMTALVMVTHDNSMRCRQALTQAKTLGFLLRYIFFTCKSESLGLLRFEPYRR